MRGWRERALGARAAGGLQWFVSVRTGPRSRFVCETQMSERSTLLPKEEESGTIEVEEIPPALWGKGPEVALLAKKYSYTWHPPSRFTNHLPNRYALRFECWENKGGNRRISPCSLTMNFVLDASLAGQLIWEDRSESPQGWLLSHHEARLFNQFARARREYLGPTRCLFGALEVPKLVRADIDGPNILPDTLGLDEKGQGERWSAQRLVREGISATIGAGPTSGEQIIRYGLLEAARLSPLQVESSQVPGLIRMAMFALGPDCDPVDKEGVAYVAGQVRASLRDHLYDTSDQFNLWITDLKSNLLHRIVKRRDCILSREQVRTALAELGWQSFLMIGQTIDAVMRAVREALPQPMDGIDNDVFEWTYLAIDRLGGISLVLLQDRLPFLKPAILAIWDLPGETGRVAVFYRMLNFYASIIEKRRQADRRYKQRARHRNEDGRPSVVGSYGTKEAQASSGGNPRFTAIIWEIARRRGLVSDVLEPQCDGRLVNEDEEEITAELGFPDGGNLVLHVSREELERVGGEPDTLEP
jgi:hypothetical protein